MRAYSADVLASARNARTAAKALTARSQAVRDIPARRLDGQLLTISALAWMHARLATLPVIEQAKGILIARNGCTPDEAFDRLRRASQRTNIPVRDLAARLVQQSVLRGAATPGRPAGEVSPRGGLVPRSR